MMSKGKSLVCLILAAALCLSAACGLAATLTLPANLKVIGEEAFYGDTSLDEVVLPEGLERIESRAFADSSVSLVHLSSQISFIDDDAFEGCEDMQATAPKGTYAYEWAKNKGILYLKSTPVKSFEYSIDGGKVTITRFVGDETEVVIPSSIAGYSVDRIGESAFENCICIESVIIPNSVTSIGKRAFWYCGQLEDVTIPNSVTIIEDLAFRSCEMKSITIPNSVTSIGAEAFDDCRELISVTLSESLESIGDRAFARCESLKSITIPNSVISIGAEVFESCSSLSNVKLSDSLKSIGEQAFIWCESLTSITIPGTVTNIGERAFCGCSNLKSIILLDSIECIDDYAFASCSGLTGIVIPDSVTSIGEGAFRSCANLESITMSDSLERIGSEAFEGCRNLINIKIPDSVTSIGSFVFENCINLTSVELSDSLTEIPYGTFDKCSSLINIEIPDSVTSIGSSAFDECSSLISVTIPDSVTTIIGSAFMNCANLTSVMIPESVKSFGATRNFFDNCPNLTIYGIAGSRAEDYAYIYGIPFSTNKMPNVFATLSGFTLNSASVELTVPVGTSLAFSGTVTAADDTELVAVQASIFDASDLSKGVVFDRAENIGADTFNLSAFDNIVVGQPYSDDKQTLTMEAGKSYDVMLYATNTNGCGFASIPTIRVNVVEAIIEEEHPHEPSTTEPANYLFHVYETIDGDNLNHTVAAIMWDVPCAICGEEYLYRDTIGYDGDYVPRIDQHTYSEDGYCTKCGYVCAHVFIDTGEEKSYTGVWKDCEDGTHERTSLMKYYECTSCGKRELRRVKESDFIPENHLISKEERIKSVEQLSDSNPERFFKHQVTVEIWNYCRTRAYGCTYEALLTTETRNMEHEFIDGVCECGYVQEAIIGREEFYEGVNWQLVYYVEHIIKDDRQFASAFGNLFNRGVDEVMGYLWNVVNFDLSGLLSHAWGDMTYAYREEAAINIIESLAGEGYSDKDINDTFFLLATAFKLEADISDLTFESVKGIIELWDPDAIEAEAESVFDKIGVVNSATRIIGNVVESATLNANQKATLQLLLSDYDVNYTYLMMKRRSAEVNNDDEMYAIYDLAMEKLEGEYEKRAKAYIDNPVDYLSFDVFISGVEMALQLKEIDPIEKGLEKLAAKTTGVGNLSKGANIALFVHTGVSFVAGELLGGNDIYDAQQKMYDNMTVLDPMQKELLRTKEAYIKEPTETNKNLLVKEAASVANYKRLTLDNVWQYRDAEWFTSSNAESSINREKSNLAVYSEGITAISNGETYSPTNAVPHKEGANHSSDSCAVCALK